MARRQAALLQRAQQRRARPPHPLSPGGPPALPPQRTGSSRRRSRPASASGKNDLKKTEDAIHQLETRDGEIDELLTLEEVYTDTARLVELNHEKEDIAAKLEALYEQWELLAEEDSQ